MNTSTLIDLWPVLLILASGALGAWSAYTIGYTIGHSSSFKMLDNFCERPVCYDDDEMRRLLGWERAWPVPYWYPPEARARHVVLRYDGWTRR